MKLMENNTKDEIKNDLENMGSSFSNQIKDNCFSTKKKDGQEIKGGTWPSKNERNSCFIHLIRILMKSGSAILKPSNISLKNSLKQI
jgi:hypothetical protein